MNKKKTALLIIITCLLIASVAFTYVKYTHTKSDVAELSAEVEQLRESIDEANATGESVQAEIDELAVSSEDKVQEVERWNKLLDRITGVIENPRIDKEAGDEA